MRKVTNILLLTVICCCSCRRSLNDGDYVRYVNEAENGLKKNIQVDGFEFCMQYKPYDYIILMENKEGLDPRVAQARLAQLKGTAWFNIVLKRADDQVTPLRYGITSIEEYNARLDYYLNKAKQDIWLVYGGDTLRPVSYLFENNFNLTPQQTMIVGFYLPKGEECPCKKMQLAYNDEVFKNGIIKATYSEKSLDEIPELKY